MKCSGDGRDQIASHKHNASWSQSIPLKVGMKIGQQIEGKFESLLKGQLESLLLPHVTKHWETMKGKITRPGIPGAVDSTGAGLKIGLRENIGEQFSAAW